MRTVNGRRLGVEFSRVHSLDALHALGMTVYVLAELEHPGALRRFSFANRDSDEDARLDVVARDFSCVEMSP